MKKYLFGLILILAVLPFVSAEECYQEFANVSTACGGLNGGSYFSELLLEYVTENPSVWFDGNWSNMATYSDIGMCNVTYQKPINSTSASLWQVKYKDTDENPFVTENLTIPQECWDYDSEYLYLFAPYQLYALEPEMDNMNFSCRSSSGFLQIKPVYNLGALSLSEEAMWWNLDNEEAVPEIVEEDIVSGTLTAVGYGVGSFVSSLNKYLLPFILIMAIISLIIYLSYLILLETKKKITD